MVLDVIIAAKICKRGLQTLDLVSVMVVAIAGGLALFTLTINGIEYVPWLNNWRESFNINFGLSGETSI
jgi:hypothetical protein